MAVADHGETTGESIWTTTRVPPDDTADDDPADDDSPIFTQTRVPR